MLKALSAILGIWVAGFVVIWWAARRHDRTQGLTDDGERVESATPLDFLDQQDIKDGRLP
jgi:hypothetical protein